MAMAAALGSGLRAHGRDIFRFFVVRHACARPAGAVGRYRSHAIDQSRRPQCSFHERVFRRGSGMPFSDPGHAVEVARILRPLTPGRQHDLPGRRNRCDEGLQRAAQSSAGRGRASRSRSRHEMGRLRQAMDRLEPRTNDCLSRCVGAFDPRGLLRGRWSCFATGPYWLRSRRSRLATRPKISPCRRP